MIQHPLTTLSRNRDQTIIVLFIAIFTFVLLFTLKAAQQTGDSLAYAFSVKTGVGMFHPHHLLYNPIVHVFFQAFSSISESYDAIFAAQIHNIIWAIVTVLAFYFIVRRLLASSLVGLLAAICLLVCQGFWIYSTQVEVYIPATGCLTLLVAILVIRHNANLTTTQIVGISLLLAMSVLYHQSNILFCLPLGYYLMATQGRQGCQETLKVLSLAGIVVLLAYVGVFLSLSGNRTLGEFLRFCLAYFEDSCPDWGTFAHLSVSGISGLFNSQLRDIVRILYFSHVSTAIFAVSIAALSVWNIIQIAKHAAHDKVRGFMLIWLITYFIYFLWWLPWEREFFITTLIPILLLAFLTLKDVTHKVVPSNSSQRNAIAAIVILTIAIISAANFHTFIASHQSRGRVYTEACELARIAPQECLIFHNYAVQQHLRYYFGRDRTIETWLLLRHLYQHEPSHELDRFREVECIVIPYPQVDPGYTEYEQFDGYSHPWEWLEFMGWLFNFEYDAQHELVACREFEVVTRNEKVYLLISSTQIQMDGLSQLFQILDNQIGESTGKQANTLQSWLSTAYPGD